MLDFLFHTLLVIGGSDDCLSHEIKLSRLKVALLRNVCARVDRVKVSELRIGHVPL